MSLLKHPSAAMTRLIQTAESNRSMGDKVLHRPVMAFVIQRHDLEGLQFAMKQSLRKAACRVFALQVCSPDVSHFIVNIYMNTLEYVYLYHNLCLMRHDRKIAKPAFKYSSPTVCYDVV